MKITKTTLKSLKTLAPAIFALSMAVGCGAAKEQSGLTVTNGVVITESNYPSAVLLVSLSSHGESICTGTFVNDSQVVTAGHCVEGQNQLNPNLFLATQINGTMKIIAKAQTYVRNPSYSIELGVSPHDVSVITFAANTAPAVTPIAVETPEVGDTFTIVGYGNNHNFLSDKGVLDGAGAGVKRAGDNRLSSVQGGMLSFAGLTGDVEAEGIQPGQYVASGSGDSGGPMFVNGELVGVTSGGGIRKTQDGLDVAMSFYVDLNSAESRAFLKSALKQPSVVSTVTSAN